MRAVVTSLPGTGRRARRKAYRGALWAAAGALCVSCAAVERGRVSEEALTCNVCSMMSVSLQDEVTPLQYACERGHVDVADLLIGRGADMSAKGWVR